MLNIISDKMSIHASTIAWNDCYLAGLGLLHSKEPFENKGGKVGVESEKYGN
jgi:hypothetical protein